MPSSRPVITSPAIPRPGARPAGRGDPPRYAELHVTSNFSFLRGASHPEELVRTAHALGYAAIAITDHATLAGIVRAHGAAKDLSFPLVVGATLETIDGQTLVVWAENRTGYANLCRLLSIGYGGIPAVPTSESPNTHAEAAGPVAGGVTCRLSRDCVAAHAAGLRGGVPLAAAAGDWRRLAAWREVFDERLCGLAEGALEGDDAVRLAEFARACRRAGVEVVAAGDVRCHVRARQMLLDALTAVRHGGTIEEVRDRLLSNGERHLHDLHTIADRFRMLPGALERSVEWAAACTFSLDELRYEYPDAVVPAGATPAGYLAETVWRGAGKRYPGGIPEKVRGLLEHELALVAELGYEAYFLTVFDIVRFARRRGILCQGRGSAANSAICYCLGITSVDPARMQVLFERFISRERREAPDIDIDFEHHRREEVIQYIYDTYGRARAAMTAEVICYRLRSAVRDMGKALGLSLDRVARIAEVLDVGDRVDRLPERLAEAGLDPDGDSCRRLTALVGDLVGFPRHLGQHVGGMVMTRGDLCDLVPIQPAAMAGRSIVQWDKDDLDELGILKVDCLALGMLTAIHRAFDQVEAAGGPRLTLASVPAEDPAVYEMVSRADTVGVFQIESRAQMSMLPRLKPRCFYDLVIEVAIVRPGPIQGGMVHPYLRRRCGEEPVSYPNDAIRGVLENTLGVPLFQEQAMRLAVVAAGFTPGEADQLRRAMGAWRRPGVIDEFHRRLVEGMTSRGLAAEFAEQVFAQIRGFGEYGFPESHAASFALLVYVSAWLKCHHPAAFTAALLASQPMGFYAPAQLVRDARQHGVRVLAVDVNASDWHAGVCGRDGEAAGGGSGRSGREMGLRLGLEQVHGLGEAEGQRIEAARRDGLFGTIDDLARRACLGREALLGLARAGALASLGMDRRRAVWEALRERGRPGSQPLLDVLADDEGTDPVDLPLMAARDEVIADYRTSGLSLEAHPLQFDRAGLARRGVITVAEAHDAPEGRLVAVAGIVLSRQRPSTAHGIIFLSVEDETGPANVVVRPEVWQQAEALARRAAAVVIEARVQRRSGVVHLLATRMEVLVSDDPPGAAGGGQPARPALPRMSRDFC
jgi:error-prone DNA polymerase